MNELLAFSSDEIWVIATAVACAIACAVPGVFLIYTRSALLGDAISHAVLPGLAIAFLLSGSRHPGVMLLGALVTGLLTAACSAGLRNTGLIKADAALGVVFTSFFALGVILLSWGAHQVDLDPGCVLYGLLEFSAFDTVPVLSFEVPRSFLALSAVALVNILAVALFFKELTLTSFDPQLAAALGFSPQRVQYGLLTLVTITAVVAFEAVGSILVVAMLITPAATAILLSRRLALILGLAAACAAAAALLGYILALRYNTSVAGMMSVAAAIFFITAFLLAPGQGVVLSWSQRLELRYTILKEDALGILYRWHEMVGPARHNPLRRADIAAALGGRWLVPLALWDLRRRGEIVVSSGRAVLLTEKGMIEAAAVVRSHRLWEGYLAKHLGLPADHLHQPSARTEHFIGRALAREIQRELETEQDPHGRDIPRR